MKTFKDTVTTFKLNLSLQEMLALDTLVSQWFEIHQDDERIAIIQDDMFDLAKEIKEILK